MIISLLLPNLFKWCMKGKSLWSIDGTLGDNCPQIISGFCHGLLIFPDYWTWYLLRCDRSCLDFWIVFSVTYCWLGPMFCLSCKIQCGFFITYSSHCHVSISSSLGFLDASWRPWENRRSSDLTMCICYFFHIFDKMAWGVHGASFRKVPSL